MSDIHFKPTIGRVLHYRVGGTDAEPELRPATVVRVWSEECLNASSTSTAATTTNGTKANGTAPTSPRWT